MFTTLFKNVPFCNTSGSCDTVNYSIDSAKCTIDGGGTAVCMKNNKKTSLMSFVKDVRTADTTDANYKGGIVPTGEKGGIVPMGNKVGAKTGVVVAPLEIPKGYFENKSSDHKKYKEGGMDTIAKCTDVAKRIGDMAGKHISGTDWCTDKESEVYKLFQKGCDAQCNPQDHLWKKKGATKYEFLKTGNCGGRTTKLREIHQYGTYDLKQCAAKCDNNAYPSFIHNADSKQCYCGTTDGKWCNDMYTDYKAPANYPWKIYQFKDEPTKSHPNGLELGWFENKTHDLKSADNPDGMDAKARCEWPALRGHDIREYCTGTEEHDLLFQSGCRAECNNKFTFLPNDNTTTHAQTEEDCENLGLRLCTNKELCKGGKPARSDLAYKPDMWVATDGGDTQQLGTTAGGRLCKTHTDVAGDIASWSSSTDPVSWRSRNICCNKDDYMTTTGKACKPWAQTVQHENSALSGRTCAQPALDAGDRPWCYIYGSNSAGKGWEYCSGDPNE